MNITMTEPTSPELNGQGDISCASLCTDTGSPVISVIVPVRNSPEELRLCLGHLFESTYSRYEVIVVDDASTDETAQVAVELGALLLSLGQRCGPAGARNRGTKLARGEILFFVDADVCATPATLQEVADTFARDPDVDAVFGSYDTRPTAGNVLSQYKNLFHHFVHQDSLEEATTFWSGCGAIRRSVFTKMGGFSARYKRPSIEDIELGMRLHAAGHRIMLNKRIQVTHLKRWTLWSIVKTDVLDRGVPWTKLMLEEGSMPNDLNLKVSQRISVVLAYGLLLTLGMGVWHYRHLIWVPLFLLVLISVLDYWSIQRRFPTVVRVLGALAGLGILAMIGFTSKVWPLLPLALIVGIVAINFRFYWFFLSKGRRLLVLLLLPLHLLYYLYCGLAFAMGFALHHWNPRPHTAAKVS
jgi:cellulose synthase/poly-beta-1,6-N-acetylglucosamine synthase-like glycosyltransferase